MSSESSQSLDSPASEAVMARLLDLENRTGYRMQQCNGQRKYWNPNWTGSPPSRGSEVFVGKIPRDLFEDELVPVFEKVGKIYELRLMMDFSGYNRGYAFVTYTNKEDALRAIELLDNYEVRPGMKIGVCRSVDNCRLFVGSLPKDKSQEEIRQAMSEVTDDVSDVIIYPGNNPGEKNRGFAFVEYTSHRAAAMARRKLIPGRITLFGYEVAVDWADPESDVSMEMMNRVKNVYVRNLKPSTTEFTVWLKFNDIRRGAIEKVKKMEDRDFAFVHFYKREDALYAVQMMNGQIIDDQEIHVSLAKPNAMTKQSLGNKTMFGGLQQQNNGSNYDSSMCGTNMPITRSMPMQPPPPSTFTMTGNNMPNYSMTNEAPSCTLRGFYNRPKSATLGMSDFSRGLSAPTPQPMNMSNSLNLQMSLNLKPVITMDHIADIKCPVTLLGELYERMCYSCPPPHYTLYFDDRSGNKDLAGNKKFKYIYRIDFMGNAYVPPCLSDTVEKAKECAAQHVLDQIGTWLRTKLNVYAKKPMPGLVNTMPIKTMPTAANLNAPLFTPINPKAHPGTELNSGNTSPWFSSWGTSENPSGNMPFPNSMQNQSGSKNSGFSMEH